MADTKPTTTHTRATSATKKVRFANMGDAQLGFGLNPGRCATRDGGKHVDAKWAEFPAGSADGDGKKTGHISRPFSAAELKVLHTQARFGKALASRTLVHVVV